MPITTDEDAAIQAISTLDLPSDAQKHAQQSIDNVLRNNEPFVDIHELFGYYNVLYFRSLLLPRVEVLWSPRLTLCAGICELSKDPNSGKFTRIRLKMSTPLLQYRPRSDTVNTLLHEAIHAYFFITTSWRHSRGEDGTGHGAGFQLLADAINNHGNYDITVYHTFHDEVDSYRTHIWQCDGPCRQKSPFFGLVKRSMNRAPGKSDSWWAAHVAECGGTYIKISEPGLTKKQKDAMSKKERAGLQKNKLDNWFTAGPGKAVADTLAGRQAGGHNVAQQSSGCHSGEKRKLISTNVDMSSDEDSGNITPQRNTKKTRRSSTENETCTAQHSTTVQCPICNMRLAESDINRHLDVVHPP